MRRGVDGGVGWGESVKSEHVNRGGRLSKNTSLACEKGA